MWVKLRIYPWGVVNLKQFWAELRRFADLINGGIFEGEQIVDPDDLAPWNPDIAIKESEEEAVDLRRDNCLLWQTSYEGEPVEAILHQENQMRIQNEWPSRMERYDAEQKHQQVVRIADARQKTKAESAGNGNPEENAGSESLEENAGSGESERNKDEKEKPDSAQAGNKHSSSYLNKAERLIQPLSFCVYYGQSPWNAPSEVEDLYGRPLPKVWADKFGRKQYQTIVIDLGHKDYPFHDPDVVNLAALLRIAYNTSVSRNERTRQLVEYTKEHDVSKAVLDVFRVIGQTDFGEYLEKNNLEFGKEGNAMVRLFEAVKEDGIRSGEAKKARDIAQTLLRKAIMSPEDIADVTGLSSEEVKAMQTALGDALAQ